MACSSNANKHSNFVAEQEDEDIIISQDNWQAEMNHHCSRPIVVGYVFGPKKMSTMGVVMAEASRTQLQQDVANPHDDEHDEDGGGCTGEADEDWIIPEDLASSPPPDIGVTGFGTNVICNSSLQQQPRMVRRPSAGQKKIVFVGATIGGGDSNNNGMDHSKHNALPSIVRFLQSSDCDKGGGDDDNNNNERGGWDGESTGTCTASTSGSQWTASTSVAIGSGSSYTSGYARRTMPVRVSFVPLDPEAPFSEQHGGQMDIILHKLTEDILCWSKIENQGDAQPLGTIATVAKDRKIPATSKTGTPELPLLPDHLSDSERAAVERVRRLVQFQNDHPACCVVDDPWRVKTLMSRADIAATLDQCLRGVVSESGIPVSSPNFTVIDDAGCASTRAEQVVDRLVKSRLTFPLIAKPLTAAGTKASHAMAVVLRPSGLTHIKGEACLLQEYWNHDASLYKVYVLGDHISVHKRRSLPNLPLRENGGLEKSTCDFVEFDSQRPYPRLEDFGFPPLPPKQNSVLKPKLEGPGAGVWTNRSIVTRAEVMPIVEALKLAFGLELFGFDILISSKKSCRSKHNESQQQMLVVDVNYFPSYKEVPNFPALLANYLTTRAIQCREAT